MNSCTQTWILPPKGTLYFIGIGGIGMSALARVFHHYGYTVKGSDKYDSQIIRELAAEGIEVTVGHSNKPHGVDIAVYSSAIDKQNEEYLWFKEQKVTFAHRGMLLAYLMNKTQSVAVTGTHGKTTTSSLIAFLAKETGLDPTALVGGYIRNYNSNVMLGRQDLIIAEVDESDKSQLYYSPKINVITNLEADHLDSYEDLNGLRAAFKTYFKNLKADAKVIYCADDHVLTELVKAQERQSISYGLNEHVDYCAKSIIYHQESTTFAVHKKGRFVDTITIPLTGEHNVLNTLASCAALELLGATLKDVFQAIVSFKGVKRRMEKLFEDKDLVVLDDYAHHPTEIKTVLTTLQRKKRRIIAIFQPHRYTRTKHLLNEFKDAFHAADHLILTDIYSAGERAIEGVTIHTLAQAVRTVYPKPCEVIPLKEIGDHVLKIMAKGDIIAFLGAGDITDVAGVFAERIRQQCRLVTTV
ncbi:MAG: UDP-N-acetylmuramate--L-alanine ligase [Candidatus Omnitrophica bacterium]|nr:UDP-N-acetylmuramate--L-alanine ligase [Candidatus Omnitrophota bacterium]